MADDRIEIEIVLDDGSIKKGFTRINTQSKKLGKTLQKNISGGLTQSLRNIAFQFTAFVGIRQITRDLLEFEKATAEIRTITQGLAIDQSRLNDELIAASVRFGTSAQQQAKAFYQIISAGITDAVKANRVLIASNKLAIGGLTSTAQAVDILTTAMNSFQQQNLTAERAADILFATVKLGKTRVDQLASTLGQVLPTASALGVSFEDVGAALAQLTTRGVSTSEAVTQLNAVFTAVLKKQELAAGISEKVGKAFSLQALQTKGLTKFLKDLNAAIGGSEAQLVKLTGRAEAARAIITLAADDFEGLGRNVEALTNSVGAADAAFNVMNNTLGQKLNVALSNLRALFLDISNITSGPLTTAIDAINFGFQNVRDAVNTFGSAIDGFTAIILISLIEIIKKSDDVANALLRMGGITRLLTLSIGLILKTLAVDGTKSLGAIEDAIARLIKPESVDLVRQGAEELKNAIKIPLDELNQTILPATSLSFGFLVDNIARNGLEISDSMAEAVGLTKEQLSTLSPAAKKQFAAVAAEAKKFIGIFQNAFVQGLSRSFAAFGSALATGKDAFKAFGNQILSTLGSLAIQLGQFFILIGAGLASTTVLLGVSGGGAIAAGIGLTILGGILQGLAGGGGADLGAVGGGGVGGAAAEDGGEGPSTGFADELVARPTTEVVINFQGVVTDPRGAAQQIAELLTDFQDSNAGEIITRTA